MFICTIICHLKKKCVIFNFHITGANVASLFQSLRWHEAKGPLVNSEFYPGWLDHWGQPHAKVSTDAIVKTLTDMLKANASVNVYVFS